MILIDPSHAAADSKTSNALSFMTHTTLVGFVLLFPLLSIASLMAAVPEAQRRTIFASARLMSPPPPPPPPPAQPSEPEPEPPPPTEPEPVETPKLPPTESVTPPIEVDEPVVEESAGEPGGVPGGVPGGIAGGVPAPEPPPQPSEPVRVDMRSEAAVPLERVNPKYPELAVDARVQGVVILDVVVDETGIPIQVSVLRGVSLLESAAVQAVQRWRWRPHVVAGRPTAFKVTVSVQFLLLDKRP